MNISMIQSGIVWENKEQNMENYYALLVPLQGKTDLVVLPETCTTGFSMHVPHLAELNDDHTVCTFRQWAKDLDFAIAGSFLAKNTNEEYFNRGFFITPDGKTYFSDKRHLFRMSEESRLLTRGTDYLIISYKGWNIRLIVCYDLRFPVWIRNKANEYDLLLCVANWPQARIKAWDVLLKARAIENECYVCGVNRTGIDGNRTAYQGNSVLIDYKGETIANAGQNSEQTLIATIDKNRLEDFRNRFPVWKDADFFKIEEK